MFHKNSTPEDIAALRERCAVLEAKVKDFEERLAHFVSKLTTVETAYQQFEVDTRRDLDLLHRSTGGDSLNDEKKKEPEQLSPGYKPWSQRKAERFARHADPQFAQRIAAKRHSGQGTDAPKDGG